MAVKTSDWDASEYLETEADLSEYLTAIMEEGNPALLQAALGDVAKARGMSEIARSAHVGRESLYKSLSADGNPSFQTIAKVLTALGIKMTFSPMERASASKAAGVPA